MVKEVERYLATGDNTEWKSKEEAQLAELKTAFETFVSRVEEELGSFKASDHILLAYLLGDLDKAWSTFKTIGAVFTTAGVMIEKDFDGLREYPSFARSL